MISTPELKRGAVRRAGGRSASASRLAAALGRQDIAALRAIDAAEADRRRGERGLSFRWARSTARSCRASWSKCSIAASRRGCRSSLASTAARFARCVSSRRRCRPTRRRMKRRSASGIGDLADDFLQLYPASALEREHPRGDSRRSVWLDGRTTRGASRRRWASTRSCTFSITAIRRRTAAGPARLPCCELPYVFGTARSNAAAVAEDSGDGSRVGVVGCDGRLLDELCALGSTERGEPAAMARLRFDGRITWPSATRRSRATHLMPGMYRTARGRSCVDGATNGGAGLELERWSHVAARSGPHGSVPMIDGTMQEFALTLDKLLDHAAKWHPRAQVVTGRDGGKTDRVSYAELKARSLRISAVLADFRRWRRRSGGDARLEYAGACRDVVRDHGHGRGLPHAQSAADALRSSRRCCAVGLSRDRRQRRSRAVGAADRRTHADGRACADHRRSGGCVERATATDRS